MYHIGLKKYHIGLKNLLCRSCFLYYNYINKKELNQLPEKAQKEQKNDYKIRG